LAIVERKPLEGSDAFFKELMSLNIKLIGQVSKIKGIEDIKEILKEDITRKLQDNYFYDIWVSDMAQICEVFCETIDSDAVGFCLTTKRGCRRYHIDNVPMRLLVTYSGEGTEWIPDEAIDHEAIINGSTNEKIIKYPSKRQFMNTWDVAIFNGGSKGLLHRTPDKALNTSSVLMRLDHPSFWYNILKEKINNSHQSIEL